MPPTLITNRSKGIFTSSAWIDEGDGLLASAKMLRAAWLDRKKEINAHLERGARSLVDWSELLGPPRSSGLLLGYAVEMYLKAGLVKAYKNCSQEFFSRELKWFGHRLYDLAKEIDFPKAATARKDFEELEKFIVEIARYPLRPEGTSDFEFSEEMNARTQALWNEDRFQHLCSLAEAVRAHAQSLDRDHSNPAHILSIRVADDGWIAFRCGGSLRARLTFSRSAKQKSANDDGEQSARHAVRQARPLHRLLDDPGVVVIDVEKRRR